MADPAEMAVYYDGFPAPPEQPASDEENEAFEEAQADHEAAHGAPPTPSPVVTPPAPGSGKPAARLGDMTAHGGMITVGEPAVMIGGQPAARVSDMHTCPMVTGVVPHVGGPVTLGSTGVMIGYMLAARMGDTVTCTGPVDMIAQGEMTVMIG